MDLQVRRQRSVQLQDQENRGHGKLALQQPAKRQGLSLRAGVLGDVNSNVQLPRSVVEGKAALLQNEADKQSLLKKSNYSHVRSKIDTGLAVKNVIQPTSRPPLRRQESTGVLALKAARSVITQKTTQTLKTADTKETKKKESKTLKPLKETKSKSKPLSKEQEETLEKLTLDLSISNECSSEDSILPDDVEDIDAGDSDSPLLLSVYVKDIFKYLHMLEEKYPIQRDYMKKQVEITGKMRATLIDWLVEVQIEFKLMLETLQLTIGIIDRYLQIAPNFQRSRLQLVGITAMFIASKYEEIYAPDIDNFICVTDNTYTKTEVLQCEKEIMRKLGFSLSRPIPLTFLRRFIKAVHGSYECHHLAKYFVDLCLIEYTMVHYNPSELAAAATCLSVYLLSKVPKLSQVWSPTLVYYTGYTFKHIEPIVKKVAAIVTNVENSRLKAVYNKYQEAMCAKVSLSPVLKSKAILELAAAVGE